jgi:hypothetical protein
MQPAVIVVVPVQPPTWDTRLFGEQVQVGDEHLVVPRSEVTDSQYGVGANPDSFPVQVVKMPDLAVHVTGNQDTHCLTLSSVVVSASDSIRAAHWAEG